MVKRLRRLRGTPHSQWHLDEMYISIGERWMYLWRAIDQDGEVLDILVQSKRDTRAAPKLMRRLLEHQSIALKTIITDRWKAYFPLDAGSVNAIAVAPTKEPVELRLTRNAKISRALAWSNALDSR